MRPSDSFKLSPFEDRRSTAVYEHEEQVVPEKPSRHTIFTPTIVIVIENELEVERQRKRELELQQNEKNE